MKINAQHLSFVFQGPITSDSARTFLAGSIIALRRLFPGCEVIVASWKGSDVSGIGVDRVVLLDDPGDLVAYAPWWNRLRFRNKNTKRLIVSSLAGLREASRSYCIKLRTDALLANDALLCLIDKLSIDPRESMDPALAGRMVFHRRILIADAFCRNPRRFPALYHLGDIFLCGLRSDLIQLFATSIDWISELEKSKPASFPWLCPEQYLWWPNLCTDKQLNLGYGFTYSLARAVDSELGVLANAEIVSLEVLGLEFDKKFDTPRSNCYTNQEIAAYRRNSGSYFYFVNLLLCSLWAWLAAQLVLFVSAVTNRVTKRFISR